MLLLSTIRSLQDSPASLSKQTGWLKTKQSKPLSAEILHDSKCPRISIITPSYNQGQFIEETIKSVLLQDYPNLEYIIIDGGSTDNTIDIIKKYEQHISYWVSEPDRGQSHAINKGFERCTGEIIAWLNSDDFYLPGALKEVAAIFQKHRNIDLVTGAGLSYQSDTQQFIPVRACGTGVYPTRATMLTKHGCIAQHSTFWRKRVLQQVGSIREDLHYAMDHEFFLRCCDFNCKFHLTAKPLAVFRKYSGQKTSQGNQYVDESAKIFAEYKIAYPEWNRFLGKIKIYFAKLIWSLSRHRNIHPRLGLAARFDEELTKNWLQSLKKNS